jgi:hypothetical protein
MLGHETFPALKSMRKTPQGVWQARAGEGVHRTVFSHPDFLAVITDLPTVGSGIGPDLLTFRCPGSARGLTPKGLPPVGNFAPP